MSQAGQTFLFFTNCPDLKRLLSFSAEIILDSKNNNFSVFHQKVLKCRELVFCNADIVATPFSYCNTTEIVAVIPKVKFYTTEFQQRLENMKLKVARIYDTSSSTLQECLQYTATAKLAPQWNTVKNLLIQGRDFLMDTRPLNGVHIELYVNEDEITLCVKPTCIKLPQLKIEHYQKMYDVTNNTIMIDERCHVLPSMKVGRALSVTKSILPRSLFKNYGDLKKHWKNMYGYRLPDISEDNIWYLNVTFKVPFSPCYSYPIFCVRPFDIIEVPRVDPQQTLHCFLSDFLKKVNNVCGEKIHILDNKASFPLLKMYPAQDVTSDVHPKLGTTYTMIPNMPYRNSSVCRLPKDERPHDSHDGRKLVQTSLQRNYVLKQNESRDYPGICSENEKDIFSWDISFQTTNVLKDALQNRLPVKNCNQEEHVLPNNIGKVFDNNKVKNEMFENIKDLSISKKQVNERETTIIPTSNSNNATQTSLCENRKSEEKYAPQFFPKRPKLTCNISQISFGENRKPGEKYAPKFFPKKPKGTYKLTDVFPKVKSSNSRSSFPSPKLPNRSSMFPVYNPNHNLGQSPKLNQSIKDESDKNKKLSRKNCRAENVQSYFSNKSLGNSTQKKKLLASHKGKTEADGQQKKGANKIAKAPARRAIQTC